MTDVEQGEWMDPAFLARVARAGMRLTLTEGEKKVQDLRLGGRCRRRIPNSQLPTEVVASLFVKRLPRRRLQRHL